VTGRGGHPYGRAVCPQPLKAWLCEQLALPGGAPADLHLALLWVAFSTLMSRIPYSCCVRRLPWVGVPPTWTCSASTTACTSCGVGAIVVSVATTVVTATACDRHLRHGRQLARSPATTALQL
jgi:hypothetical protein